MIVHCGGANIFIYFGFRINFAGASPFLISILNLSPPLNLLRIENQKFIAAGFSQRNIQITQYGFSQNINDRRHPMLKVCQNSSALSPN